MKFQIIFLIFSLTLIFSKASAGSNISTCFSPESKVKIAKIVNNTQNVIKITNSKQEELLLPANSKEDDYNFEFPVLITNNEDSVKKKEADLKIEFDNEKWISWVKFIDIHGIEDSELILKKWSKTSDGTKNVAFKSVCKNCKYDHRVTIRIMLNDNNIPMLDVKYCCLDKKNKELQDKYEQ